MDIYGSRCSWPNIWCRHVLGMFHGMYNYTAVYGFKLQIRDNKTSHRFTKNSQWNVVRSFSEQEETRISVSWFRKKYPYMSWIKDLALNTMFSCHFPMKHSIWIGPIYMVYQYTPKCNWTTISAIYCSNHHFPNVPVIQP